MVIHITGLFREIWNLLNEMSPYLLFGFFIAGILHVFIPKEKIYKHFKNNNLAGIIKASLFGVPLPLCSCGVIPVAAHLRKQGGGVQMLPQWVKIISSLILITLTAVTIFPRK